VRRWTPIAGLCTAAVLLYAVWTVLCNLAVWWRLSLDTLIAAFSATLFLGAALEGRRRVVGKPSWFLRWVGMQEEDAVPDGSASRAARARTSEGGHPRAPFLKMILAAGGAAAAVGVYAQTQEPAPFAAAALTLLVVALLSNHAWKQRADAGGAIATAPPVRRRDLVLLTTIAVALVLLTLAAHHADTDDCFYGNVVARAAGSPGQPFLQHDGIFGIEGAPLLLPAYRAHSFEALAAAISRLTHLTPILSLHWVMAALAAFLSPFAWAFLLRRLLPGHWQLATLLTLALLLSLGDGHASYGNFAFIRLHQGKGVLLTVGIPLVAAMAMRYAAAPSPPRALALWASQTAAMGLSFSGLSVVPIAWLVLVGMWRGRWNRWFLLGLLCSVHPLLLAGIMAAPMQHSAQALARFKNASDPGRTPFAVLDHAMKMVLGQDRMRLLALFLVLFAWSVPRDRRVARVLILLPLAFFLAFNPVAVRLFANTPSSRELWFRSFWVLPLPAMMAVGLSATAVLLDRWRKVGWISTVILATVLIPGSRTTSPLSSRNDTWWHWPPQVKAPPADYAAARLLVEKVEEGARVVAPEAVAAWVPTFRKRVYPLFTRFYDERYLLLNLPADEVYKRRTLTGFVSGAGHHLEFPEVICFNSRRFGLSGWCLRDFGSQTDTAMSQADQCGFRRIDAGERYRIYVRPGVFPPSADPAPSPEKDR